MGGRAQALWFTQAQSCLQPLSCTLLLLCKEHLGGGQASGAKQHAWPADRAVAVLDGKRNKPKQFLGSLAAEIRVFDQQSVFCHPGSIASAWNHHTTHLADATPKLTDTLRGHADTYMNDTIKHFNARSSRSD